MRASSAWALALEVAAFMPCRSPLYCCVLGMLGYVLQCGLGSPKAGHTKRQRGCAEVYERDSCVGGRC